MKTRWYFRRPSSSVTPGFSSRPTRFGRIQTIVRISRLHKNTDRLVWDIYKLPLQLPLPRIRKRQGGDDSGAERQVAAGTGPVARHRRFDEQTD